MKICNICNETFESGRSYSNHVRWKHKNVIFYDMEKCQFCDKLMGNHLIVLHENSCIKNPKNVKYCKQCNKIIINYKNEFCSSSCAATYNNKRIGPYNPYNPYKSINIQCKQCNVIFTKKNTQHKGICDECRKKEYHKHILTLTCEICNEIFTHYVYMKTCSKKCMCKLLSIKHKANPNCGGETNYRKFTYKGIYMDSSWELEIAQYMDNQNIEWQRTRKIMFWWTDKNGLKRRYYPDFYLPKYDLYLDPKNKYLLKLDEYKLNQVIKENNINLIYGHKNLILEKLMGL